jgi:hypothetical protein
MRRRRVYATLQTPGGAVRAPLVLCAAMLKLAAKSADFRAGWGGAR